MATSRFTKLSVTTSTLIPAITLLTGLSVTTHADTAATSGIYYADDDGLYQPYTLYTLDDFPLD